MKKILIILLSLVTINTFASESYKCETKKHERIAFEINDNQSIVFKDTNFFGGASILKNEPMPVEVDSGSYVKFTYEWYYVAVYEMFFVSRYNDTLMYLNFDDDDGAWGKNIKFYCKIQKN